MSKIVCFKRKMGLGDVIMASGVINEYMSRNPENVVCISTDCTEILQHIDPQIKNFNSLDFMTQRTIYDEIINLDLVYENDPNIPVWKAYAKVVFGDKYSKNTIRPGLKWRYDTKPTKSIVIHAPISSLSRTIPRTVFSQIIKDLEADYEIIVLSKDNDYEFEGDNVRIAKNQSINTILNLIHNAKLFIGTDSGMMHLAQATITPIIGMFTIANPLYRIWRRNNVYPVVPSSDCKFCLSRLAPPVTSVNTCDKNYECISSFNADEIISLARSILCK